MKATHQLLAYERRLVIWKMRRWRAKPSIDLAQVEREDGPERIRLLAAFSAGFDLAKLLGLSAVAAGVLGEALFGLPGGLAGFGTFFAALLVVGAIAVRRQWQSEDARAEYRQGKPPSQH